MVEDSKFENNRANIQGGAIFYNYNHPTTTNTIFSNNSASYGPNFASYAARIGFVGSLPDDELSIRNVGSGITVEKTIQLALFDLDDQVLNLDSTSQINIIATNQTKASIKGTNVETVNQGVASFDSIAPVIDQSFRVANYTVNSKSIDFTKVRDVLGSTYEQRQLTVAFRDCQPGERILGDECDL